MPPSAPVTVAEVLALLEQECPAALAEDWDNIGLLLGNRSASVQRVLTCLTLTEDVARAAVADGVGLIIAHHPVLFRPVQRITSDSAEGRTLLTLLRAGIAVCSMHTAYDSARQGINQQLAERLGLVNIRLLRPNTATGDAAAEAGGGRYGALVGPQSLSEFLDVVHAVLGAATIAHVGAPDAPVRQVAVACGSAAEFLGDAAGAGCDVLLTGEARFHACLEARERGIALVLAGHYQTERPGVELLAEQLAAAFPGLTVTASPVERDPVQWSCRHG